MNEMLIARREGLTFSSLCKIDRTNLPWIFFFQRSWMQLFKKNVFNLSFHICFCTIDWLIDWLIKRHILTYVAACHLLNGNCTKTADEDPCRTVYSERAKKQNLKFSLTRWHTDWLHQTSRLSLHSDNSVCWVSHIFLKVPAGLLLLCSDELLTCDLLMWQRSRFARILTRVPLPCPPHPAPVLRLPLGSLTAVLSPWLLSCVKKNRGGMRASKLGRIGRGNYSHCHMLCL